MSTTTVTRTAVLLSAKLALAGALLVGIGQVAAAQAAPLEDEPGWSCTTQGNEYCGENNSNGVDAGWYDDGVLTDRR